MHPLSRRRWLLSATGIAGVGALASKAAFAFSLQSGNAEVDALVGNRCSAQNPYHAQLVADLVAKLKGHSQAEIEAALATARCPICGCPIA
jgi:hypothetical protein